MKRSLDAPIAKGMPGPLRRAHLVDEALAVAAIAARPDADILHRGCSLVQS